MKFIVAKFVSSCPFCGMAIVPGRKIALADTEQFMHPICARFSNEGKTFRDLQLARRIAKRSREIAKATRPRQVRVGSR